jgi:hypothetical protein
MIATIADFGCKSHSIGWSMICRDTRNWLIIPPELANMNLKRSPATVTGSSQEIIVIPLKKEHPANFLLNNNASAKPMINWKKIEPTVKINVFAIDLVRIELPLVNNSI